MSIEIETHKQENPISVKNDNPIGIPDPESKFHVELEDVRTWKSVIETLKFCDEANFIIVTEKGLECKGFNTIKSGMISLVIPADCFKNFHCTNTMKLGLNFQEFDSIMKRAKNEDVISLDLDIRGINALLNATFEHLDSTRKFGVSLLDLPVEIFPKTDSSVSNVRMVIDSTILKQMISDSVDMGNQILFIADTEKLVINCLTDNGTSNYDLTIPKGSRFLTEYEIKEPSSSRYNRDYLEAIIRPMIDGEPVKLSFSSSLPLFMETNVMGKGNLLRLLAPRIEV